MTLLYWLFGRPGNIDEVVDRARRTGEISEVYATRRNVGTLVPATQRFEYRVGVRIGKIKVWIDKWEQTFEFFVQELNKGRYDFVAAEEDAQEKVRKLAEELNRRGIMVLYGNEIYYNSERIASLN